MASRQTRGTMNADLGDLDEVMSDNYQLGS